jgi:hypothetical protein
VVIAAPGGGAVVAAGTDVGVALQADDGLGQLASLSWTITWSGSTQMTAPCMVAAGAAHAACSFSFTAPKLDALVDAITIEADAADAAGNSGSAATQIWVALAPTVTTFSPSTGPAAGGPDIHVQGTNFVAVPGGTQLWIGGALVDPITVDSPTELHGPLPPHDPGLVALVVKTGSITVMPGFFDYVAAPGIRAVSPASGPVAGGTPVQIAGDHFRLGATQFFFGTPPGAPELVCPTFVSEHLVTGLAPPAGAGAGPVMVVATDPVGGSSQSPQAFTYLSVDAGADAADAGPPMGCGASDGGTP